MEPFYEVLYISIFLVFANTLAMDKEDQIRFKKGIGWLYGIGYTSWLKKIPNLIRLIRLIRPLMLDKTFPECWFQRQHVQKSK